MLFRATNVMTFSELHSGLEVQKSKKGNKCPKETILDIWRNEKYFSDLLMYQLFGYDLAKIQ